VSELVIERVTGAAIAPYLDDLAQLRIDVFREFPYLYEGSLDYEARYLHHYAHSERSIVVVARAGARIVGASTALPAPEHQDDVGPALQRAGLDPCVVYYFGESVLRAEFRSRGIGHAFFDQREARARELGFKTAAFCAVERPAQHPKKPAGYRPHDVFWNKRGYTRQAQLRAEFSWRDVDETAETPKPMVFWLKPL
jgi:GNAT superfamily N-acetyltransferase